MFSSTWSDNSIPARPDPEPSIYTPPSTKPSSIIKPNDTDDEVYVQLRVAGKWTHVKIPAQTAEEWIAEGVAYPATSSTEALEQVPAREAPVRGADTLATSDDRTSFHYLALPSQLNTPSPTPPSASHPPPPSPTLLPTPLTNSSNTCSSNPPPSFVALASQCYNKKLPANPGPSLRSKMPGTHNFTLVELASGAKKLVSDSVYPDRIEEPATTANVPTKPRLGNDPTSSLVSNAGSVEDLNAATANATNLKHPLPFESHLHQCMANKDVLPVAASALPHPSTNEDVTNVDPFHSEAARDPSPSSDEWPCGSECWGCDDCVPPSERSPVYGRDGGVCDVCGGCGGDCIFNGPHCYPDNDNQATFKAELETKRPTHEVEPSKMVSEANHSSKQKQKPNDSNPNPFGFSSRVLREAVKITKPPLRKTAMPGSWDDPVFAADHAPCSANTSNVWSIDYQQGTTNANGPKPAEEQGASLQAKLIPSKVHQLSLAKSSNAPSSRPYRALDYFSDLARAFEPPKTAQMNQEQLLSVETDTRTKKLPPLFPRPVDPLLCPRSSEPESSRCRGCLWGCGSYYPIQADEVPSTPEVNTKLSAEGDAQRPEATQDEASPTTEHAGPSCAVCNFKFSDRISFEQECPLCGVAVDYIRTRDTVLFLADRDRIKTPTVPQAFARIGVDPSQGNSIDVIANKLQKHFDERPYFMPELFKAMAVICAESVNCSYNDDHRKTGGIGLGTEEISAETQNNEQSEPIPFRDWAWGPSMETFQADKDNKDDTQGPSRLDSEEEVPWWGRPNGAGFGGNEDNETKASSAAELQSDTASANNGWASETPPSKDLAVTYWATIESGNHTVHIPMDADDVVAQEKAIIDTSMKKVWNWVRDKKLEDKISLQDAFDLAREMHPDPIEADEDGESDDDSY